MSADASQELCSLAEPPAQAAVACNSGGTDLGDIPMPPSASTPAPESAAQLGDLGSEGTRHLLLPAPIPRSRGPGVTGQTPASVSTSPRDPCLPARCLSEFAGTGRGEAYAGLLGVFAARPWYVLDTRLLERFIQRHGGRG